jgi:hypothetical protein
MPIKVHKLEKALTRKLGFTEAKHRSADHVWYELSLPGLPTIATKVSHGQKELSRKLESLIAKQLRIRKSLLMSIFACHKGRSEYEEQVRNDPYPPFSVRF